MIMGARRGGGGARETLNCSLEFEKNEVLQNTLKFSLEPSALTLDTLYFSLKRREKNAKIFVCALGRLVVRRAENVSTF